MVARRADRLNELALELRTRCGVEVLTIAADLSTPEGQAEFESETEHLDVGLLVASAAMALLARYYRRIYARSAICST